MSFPCAGTLRDGTPCNTNAPPGESFCGYHQALERGEVYRKAWGMGQLHIHVPEGQSVITVSLPVKKVGLFQKYLEDAGVRTESEVRT